MFNVVRNIFNQIEDWPYKYQFPIVIGKRLSEFTIKERRLPTRIELDRVSKDFSAVISSIEFHPLLAVHSAVNHPNPDSRIIPYEALEMCTINGAYAIFQDKEKGSLQIGKKADFVILDQQLNVVQTWIGGEIFYECE